MTSAVLSPSSSWPGAVLALLVSLGLAAGAPAQPHTAWPPDGPERLQRGLDAVEAGHPEAARPVLEALFKEAAAFYTPDLGSAAYWLGRAHADLDAPDQALRVWEAGLDHLDAAGRFDPRLAEAYLERVFGDSLEAAYGRAADLYLRLLETADTLTDAAARPILRRHIARILPLVPESERGTLGRPVAPNGFGILNPDRDAVALQPGAGARAALWWRRTPDPVLATGRHERIEEHLSRVAYARAHFPCSACATGYDDRGEIFVRLGPPPRAASITFDDSRLLDILLHPNAPHISRRDFPKNAVWYYPDLGYPYGRFVFIDNGERYQAGGLFDLIPLSLRTAGGFSRRSAMLATMRDMVIVHIYEELQRTHTGIGDGPGSGSAQEIYQEARLRMAELATQESAYEAAPASPVPTEIQQEDRLYAVEQRLRMPEQHTNVLEEMEDLPVFFRLARFLDADRTTRTELFWTHPAGTFEEAPFLVDFYAAQLDHRFQRRAMDGRSYPPARLDDPQSMSVSTFTLRGDTATYHLRLQWLQRPRRERSYSIDSLQALNPDPAVLEMSDLLPALMPEIAQTGGGIRLTPYPLPRIRAGMPLALYFEIYHLRFGPDDQTRYAVEVVVERRDAGTLQQLYRDRTRRTAARTDVEGTTSTAREYIAVDLSDVRGAESVTVTVRVTDEVSEQVVERSVQFDVFNR